MKWDHCLELTLVNDLVLSYVELCNRYLVEFLTNAFTPSPRVLIHLIPYMNSEFHTSHVVGLLICVSSLFCAF